jgi:hypothetical protein
VIATGVAYRRLDTPGVNELVSSGVAYGSAPAQAPAHRDQDARAATPQRPLRPLTSRDAPLTPKCRNQ